MAVSPVASAKRERATENREPPPTAGPTSADTATATATAPRKRTKDPGVRVIGGRIYDSQNGKTCHQCRQKTMDFAARCGNEARKGKPCPISFCHKCLLNRYGENAEDVGKLENWCCPRCRGICNCSFCMKKKGQEPTGILVRTAKASGFNSVSELLHNKGPCSGKEVVSYAKSPISSTKSGKKDAVKLDIEVDARASQYHEGASNDPKKERKRKLKLETCTVGDRHEAHEEKINKMNEEGLVPVEGGAHKTDCQKEMQKEKIQEEGKNKPKKPKKMKVKENVNEEGLVPVEVDAHKADYQREMQKGKIPEQGKNKPKKLKKMNVEKENMKARIQINGCAGNEDAMEVKKAGFPDEEKEKHSKSDKVKVEKNKNIENRKAVEKESMHIQDTKRKKKDIENAKMNNNNNADIKNGNTTKKNTNIEYWKVKNGEMKAIRDVQAALKNLKCKAFRNCQAPDLNIPLPEGSILTSVAGLELAAENVGPALQFLEFCVVFKKVLGLKKGHAENILRDLSRGPVGRRGLPSTVALFHVKLLSIILQDIGEKPPPSSAVNDGSWLRALADCIDRSEFLPKEIPSGLFSEGVTGYHSLDFSGKLGVLNFLCDEALGTGELRLWIEEENARFIDMKKEDKENILASKEKKKSLKQKLKNELAQAVLSWRTDMKILTISEHDKLLSEIKEKTQQIHSQLQDSTEISPKRKRQPDAVRTEPALLEDSGKTFWRLKCCEGSSGVLLQDTGSWEVSSMDEKWFTYDDEQEKVIEKHVTLVRQQRSKRIRTLRVQEARPVLKEKVECNSIDACPAAQKHD